MSQALADVDEKVSDIGNVAKVLGSPPLKYSGFVAAWDSYDETKKKFDNLTSKKKERTQRIKALSPM